MNTPSLQIIDFLTNLGLSPEESKICLVLINDGPQTMLQLSKKSGINRTTAYRICEHLEQTGIVNLIKSTNSTKASIASFEDIKRIVTNKLYKAKQLQTLLSEIQMHLSNTTIIEHQFIQIIDQTQLQEALINITKESHTLLTFKTKNWEDLLGLDLSLKFFENILKQQTILKEIYTPKLLTQISMSPKIKYYYSHFKKHFQSKMVNSKYTNFTHQTIILKTSIIVFYPDENKILEVKIPELANLQKNFFYSLWESN
jgi:sugar-specific transcriptional regulator TrmB